MNQTLMELSIEVSSQCRHDISLSHAEDRWRFCEIARAIFIACKITKETEDLDEIVRAYLIAAGWHKEQANKNLGGLL